MMEKTLVFIYISSDRIQHEFFIHFFLRPIIKSPEFFIFLDIAKMSLCLDGTDLTFQYPFLALDIGIGSLLKLLPLFVDLHDLIFFGILFFIIPVQAPGFMLTSAAVCASVDFKSLRISFLLFRFRAQMSQLPSFMADVIMFVLKDFGSHVVILSDIFLIRTGLSLLMILELDIAGNPMFFQIQQVSFTTVAAVSRDLFQNITKCRFVLFQDRDQRIVIRPVIALIAMDNKIVLNCDLDIISRL